MQRFAAASGPAVGLAHRPAHLLFLKNYDDADKNDDSVGIRLFHSIVTTVKITRGSSPSGVSEYAVRMIRMSNEPVRNRLFRDRFHATHSEVAHHPALASKK
jgi:hypothetical protein